ncbi:MAG TPA: BTAD domain-containing putative transcriptional regulator [Stellaceae bacterium]|nr:BTAD domain-containing putative transcriptional regulator [Stellaceae bacterium]
MSLTIHMLGSLVIKSDDGRLDKLPKKARALLAFLAAQNGEAVSRERLADLLWPYQGSEQGRHSLRNCLLELRKALGREAASDLGADFANCRIENAIVDLDDFERLSRSQDRAELETAADLYRGDFLADFYIASEPFQEWLAAARDRALAAICDVLERLIALHDAAGDYESAIQSGRRLVTLEPLSESGQRALMRAYARGGRRGEALRQYKSCANTLQRELSVTPDEETQALARSIARSGGEGNIARGTPSNQVRPSLSAMSDRVVESRGPLPQERTTPGSEKPQWPCLLPSIAVAVAPMRNLTGNPDRQHLVEAFTDDLVTDLLRQGRALSLKPLRGDQPTMGKLARSPASEREHDYVITGSAQRGNSETLRVNMRIVDAATSEFVWAGRHEFRPEELAPIQTRITRRISRELHVLLLQAASRRAFFDAGKEHGVTDSLSRAASALQQGMRAELSAEAQRWYLTALASDPRNVEALTGLAITCQHLVSNPWWAEPRVVASASDLGREAAAIALSIAPGHTAAHSVQGMLYSAAGQLDEAAGAFDRALATDSGQGTVHGFAGYNAAFLGRAEETVPAIERAMSLDRSDRRHSIWLFFGGFAELLLGRTEASISLLRKSLERNPSYGSAQLFLAAALSTIGQDKEASEAAAKFRGLYPQHRTHAFEQLWLSRSGSAAYRAQIHPAFGKIRRLGLIN